jgi:hypothetical protein
LCWLFAGPAVGASCDVVHSGLRRRLHSVGLQKERKNELDLLAAHFLLEMFFARTFQCLFRESFTEQISWLFNFKVC